MKKLLLVLALAGTTLFGADKIININGNFAQAGKGWSSCSRYGKVFPVATGGIELKAVQDKVPYLDAFYQQGFIVNATDKLVITATAKGEGFLKLGINGVGNQVKRVKLTPDFKVHTVTIDAAKFADKLPAKCHAKIILDNGRSVVLKNIALTIK